MVAQDQVTAWDLKPNRENTNQIFNVLCNVQPVEHPWSGDGPNKYIDVTEGSKQQFWFEKCKGLKKCKLYEYHRRNGEVMLREASTDTEKGWENANFTDVITFQGYRLYMRKKNEYIDPYGNMSGIMSDGKKHMFVQTDLAGNIDHPDSQGNVDHQVKDQSFRMGGGDDDPDTCDEFGSYRKNDKIYYVRPSRDIRLRESTYDDGERPEINEYNATESIRIYAQPIDTTGCSGDTFDDPDSGPIILMREYRAAECNPDHFIMGYGGLGVPDGIKGKDGGQVKIAIIYFGGQHFAYLYNIDRSISITDYVYIPELSIYISGLTAPETNSEQMDIIMRAELPGDGYFIPNISELGQVVKYPEIIDEDTMAIEISDIGSFIWAYKEYGEVPYFVSGNDIYSINGYYSRNDTRVNIPSNKDRIDLIYRGNNEVNDGCVARPIPGFDPETGEHQYTLDRRILLFDNLIQGASNKDIITGIESRGTRLTYIANNHLYVSGSGMLNGLFTPVSGDTARGVFNIPTGLTDLRAMYGSLLLFGQKHIYAISNQEALVAGNFIKATENGDGYYNPGSYYNDDGEFLIVRRGKLLETLQFSAYYGTVQFTPDTGFFVNGHIKPLNNKVDKINIDATINHRYICIYDDNHANGGIHYSKILIYNKHYNCWYYWLIDGARVIHVKDGIFLGDGIYANKGDTRGWTVNHTKTGDVVRNGGEIIEVISAYVGEEGLQTPKHIQYVKTAIGDHSEITNWSTWEINTSFGGRLYERKNTISTTRHPQLLSLKNSINTIKVYDNGEKIYGHGKMYPHTLFNEIAGYRDYNYSSTTIREMGEDSDLTSKLAMFASIKEPVNAPANVLELCISARKTDNVQFGSFYIGYYALDPDYEDIENTNIDQSGLTDEAIEYGPVVNKGEYCDEILSGSACDSSEMNDQL